MRDTLLIEVIQLSMMEIIKNKIIQGADNRPTLLDAYWQADNAPKPIVIFSHGYKGYKDWGAWELIAQTFAKAGFVFVKFNFSHNGGTVKEPIDFPDLEAFGQNNLSKELTDLGIMIDWCFKDTTIPLSEKNTDQLALIGHSRGGGITILKAAQDSRVKALVTWAAVSDYGTRFPKEKALEEWKKSGVFYVMNGRTKQQMPHFYQYYEDFKKHENTLNIRAAAEKLDKPFLIIHGEADAAVNPLEARSLHQWNPQSKLKLMLDTGHTFDTKHPWAEEVLPDAMQGVVHLSIDFLKGMK